MPKGSIFKAVGFRDGHLLLENGLKISTAKVRKLKPDL